MWLIVCFNNYDSLEPFYCPTLLDNTMSNVTRLKNVQDLIYGSYTAPSFIPNDRSIQTERAKRFAAQKLLAGWDPKDVIEYLVNFNYYSPMKARAIVVPLYNRLTTPIKELREREQ